MLILTKLGKMAKDKLLDLLKDDEVSADSSCSTNTTPAEKDVGLDDVGAVASDALVLSGKGGGSLTRSNGDGQKVDDQARPDSALDSTAADASSQPSAVLPPNNSSASPTQTVPDSTSSSEPNQVEQDAGLDDVSVVASNALVLSGKGGGILTRSNGDGQKVDDQARPDPALDGTVVDTSSEPGNVGTKNNGPTPAEAEVSADNDATVADDIAALRNSGTSVSMGNQPDNKKMENHSELTPSRSQTLDI